MNNQQQVVKSRIISYVRLNNEQKKELINRYNNGEEITTICFDFNINRSTLFRIVKRAKEGGSEKIKKKKTIVI